jgi:hypothetical protein
MFKQKSSKFLIPALLTVSFFTACTKEDVLAPNENTAAENQTVIFIRAIDKDSSVVESSQLLLR